MAETPLVRTRTLSGYDEFVAEMERLGAHADGVKIMSAKTDRAVFLIERLDCRGANILKQEMLAVGAECCVPHKALLLEGGSIGVLVFGEIHRILRASKKLDRQPFGLADVAEQMRRLIEARAAPPGPLEWGAHRLVFGKRTLVMGVLNVTSDSFYDGGKYAEPAAAIARAREMAAEGADIIDVGAESTRPGAQALTVEEEIARLEPVLSVLLRDLDVPISLDTSKSRVAAHFLPIGKFIINDVTGLVDPTMTRLAETQQVPVVIMHMLGTPQTMQDAPAYGDVVGDIMAFFRERIHNARVAGIPMERIIIDPGIGFGKTLEHNLEIIRRLDELRDLGLPIMVGLSRKSFLGKLGAGEKPEDRLEGSLGAAVAAAMRGADILRVHDVAATRRALAVADAVR